MPGHGTHEAVYLPDAACPRVELAADRLREASCTDELSYGGAAQGEEVEGGFRTGGPSERVVDYIVGARH